MLLTQILRGKQQLDAFRHIEARIESFGEPTRSYQSGQNWGKNVHHILWLRLNWPEKVSTHCNSGLGFTQQLVSAALPSDGETGLPDPLIL